MGRLERALLALEGLSVGDSFGERFFVHPDIAGRLVELRALPSPPWAYTDDTEMALSVVATLRRRGAVDQDELARSFAERYDPSRGYGPAMHRLLRRVREGEGWRAAAGEQFAGQGSYGNGAAMRSAPVGAFFADDLGLALEQARLAAEVTHAHSEGIAGAAAVALAAAWAWRMGQGAAPAGRTLLDLVAEGLPPSEVRSRLDRARGFAPDLPAAYAAAMVGSGQGISAQDTVPYALWCAAVHLGDYEEALWHTASGGGDVDTTCAIVGGIVALRVGEAGLPQEWRRSREPLPHWHLADSSAGLVTLYRPVGAAELALIEVSGRRAFPPRLPEQPIFYPVLDETYAEEIARGWNTRDAASGNVGYVTRFQVRADFLERYRPQAAGAARHREYWIPAEDLAGLNAAIVGLIEVLSEHRPE